MKKLFFIVVLSVCLTSFVFSNGGSEEESKSDGKIKIGFVVKDASSDWFQNEWKFAEQAGEEMGFEVIKIEATDGSALLSALDNLGSQQVQGVIACVPDVKLGPAIVAKSKEYGFKLMTVDDRLLGSDGNPIEEVPHMGISALNVGKLVGEEIAKEVKNRGWNMKEVYSLVLTYTELPTLKERTDGASESLMSMGLPKANILEAPQKDQSSESAFNAANIVIAKNLNVKKWVVYGFNDETIASGVRALEGNGVSADDVIAIGIGGYDIAVGEFEKEDVTGFFGTVVLASYRHGYETAVNMYNWIAKNQEPEKLILTSGYIATRANYKQVRKELGLE